MVQPPKERQRGVPGYRYQGPAHPKTCRFVGSCAAGLAPNDPTAASAGRLSPQTCGGMGRSASLRLGIARWPEVPTGPQHWPGPAEQPCPFPSPESPARPSTDLHVGPAVLTGPTRTRSPAKAPQRTKPEWTRPWGQNQTGIQSLCPWSQVALGWAVRLSKRHPAAPRPAPSSPQPSDRMPTRPCPRAQLAGRRQRGFVCWSH